METIVKFFRAVGMLTIVGPLAFLLIDWMNGGNWGRFSIFIVGILCLGSFLGGFSEDEDQDKVETTPATLTKGLLYGVLTFVAVALLCKWLTLPAWCFFVGIGIASTTVSVVAKHKPQNDEQ
jgi:hypothetical protein